MQNDTETSAKNGANSVQRRSGPVRYELIDKNGKFVAGYQTAASAAIDVMMLFPGEEQDEDRTGKGWDVQVVGTDR